MLDLAHQDGGTDDRLTTGATLTPRDIASAVNNWVPHDIVLKDAWFPLAHSTAVRKRPVRRSVYSQPYFLWRENGVAVGAEFYPKAGITGPKSPYTDAAGRYPVLEKYGFVWGWYGRPEAADPVHLPNVPYLPEAGGLPWYMRSTIRFDCSALLSLENLIDLTHADFLHAKIVGDEKSDEETVEVFHTSETITMVRKCRNKSVAPVMKLFSGVKQDVQQVQQVIHIYLRSHCALAYGRFTPGDDVHLFHPCVPETRDRTRQEFAMNTSKAHRLFRYFFPKMGYIISSQDGYMTSTQSPRYMRPEKRRDLHSPFDEASQKYRALIMALVQRQAEGDFDYRDNVSADCSALIGYSGG